MPAPALAPEPVPVPASMPAPVSAPTPTPAAAAAARPRAVNPAVLVDWQPLAADPQAVPASRGPNGFAWLVPGRLAGAPQPGVVQSMDFDLKDRKSTRLNSSHLVISYAVFCLKKKKKKTQATYILSIETHVTLCY